MKIYFKKEYAIIVGLSLLLIIISLLSDVLRTILGLPFALFLPGYLLTVILFPKKDELGGMERAALSVGLSLIIVPLIGLLLNYSSWGVRLLPMMVSLTILDIILIVPGWYRRANLPKDESFALNLKIGFTKWSDQSKASKVIHTALLITGLLLIVTLLYILSAPKAGDSFTEFYLVNQYGEASGYPEHLQAGEPGTVNVAIINNEQQNTVYRMEIRIDGEIIQDISPIPLEPLETWNKTVSFKSDRPKDAVKVEFLLYRDHQDITPYRQLRLWIEILP